jgi:Cdc6-like AAA superfamily ATPase
MPVDLLGHDESLFIAPGVLDQEYLPRLLHYREEQQKYLANCIKNIRLNGTNLLLYGRPGIGKTAYVRWVFRNLKGSEEQTVPIYINCWENDTLHKILLWLCNQFNLRVGIQQTEELLEIVLRKLKESSLN